MLNTGLMSSAKQDWRTPKIVLDYVNREWGNIILDLASSDDNAVCPLHCTESHPFNEFLLDGLPDGLIWCNPPYNKQKEFCEIVKSIISKGRDVVMLVPARTDTKLFHEFYALHVVVFIKGRLKFSDSNSAPFPSMLVWLSEKHKGLKFFDTLDLSKYDVNGF